MKEKRAIIACARDRVGCWDMSGEGRVEDAGKERGAKWMKWDSEKDGIVDGRASVMVGTCWEKDEWEMRG